MMATRFVRIAIKYLEMSEIKLSLRQIELMRHAIGLGNEKLKKSRYDAYRNYVVLNGEDKDWEELVSIGYAVKYKVEITDKVSYHVTGQGAKFLTCLFGVLITLGDN